MDKGTDTSKGLLRDAWWQSWGEWGVLSPFQSFIFTRHPGGQPQSGAPPSPWNNRDLTPGTV